MTVADLKTALLEKANEILLSIGNKNAKLLPGEMTENVPTQKDKPSPKSSLTVEELERRLYQSFRPRDGFVTSPVANTNSMEPLLDDSDVVVLELLSGEYKERLALEPLREGQIVIYEDSAGRRIIHTLKEKTTFLGKPAWIIQGNNNFLPDMAKVTEDKIIMRLVGVCYGRTLRGGD